MAGPKIPFRDKRTQEQVILDATRERDQSQQITQGRSPLQEMLGNGALELSDFVKGLIPQSVEELAGEAAMGGPAGAAAGAGVAKAIGFIPPKYVKALVDRLTSSRIHPNVPYPDFVRKMLEDNPHVSATLDGVGLLSDTTDKTLHGKFIASRYRPSALDVEEALDTGESIYQNAPHRADAQGQAIFLNPQLGVASTGNTMRHEMTHAAQHIVKPFDEWQEEAAYKFRPIEVSARVAGQKGANQAIEMELAKKGINPSVRQTLSPDFNYISVVEKELNKLNQLDAPIYDRYLTMQGLNDRFTKGNIPYRVVMETASSPISRIGALSGSPTQNLMRLQRIVLDK